MISAQSIKRASKLDICLNAITLTASLLKTAITYFRSEYQVLNYQRISTLQNASVYLHNSLLKNIQVCPPRVSSADFGYFGFPPRVSATTRSGLGTPEKLIFPPRVSKILMAILNEHFFNIAVKERAGNDFRSLIIEILLQKLHSTLIHTGFVSRGKAVINA